MEKGFVGFVFELLPPELAKKVNFAFDLGEWHCIIRQGYVFVIGEGAISAEGAKIRFSMIPWEVMAMLEAQALASWLPLELGPGSSIGMAGDWKLASRLERPFPLDLPSDEDLTAAFRGAPAMVELMKRSPMLKLAVHDYHEALKHVDSRDCLIYLHRANEAIKFHFGNERQMFAALPGARALYKRVARLANDAFSHARHSTKTGQLAEIDGSTIGECLAATRGIIERFAAHVGSLDASLG